MVDANKTNNHVQNWLHLATSPVPESNQLALVLAEELAANIQVELLFWLAQNLPIGIQLQLHGLLLPEYRALLHEPTFEDLPKFSADIHPIRLIKNTNDFEQKAAIIELDRRYIAIHHRKRDFVSEYRQLVGDSLTKAGELYERLNQPAPFSDEVEAWLGLASSPDFRNRKKAFEQVPKYAEQMQDALVGYFFRMKQFAQAYAVYQLLQPSYQQLVHELTKHDQLAPFRPNKLYQCFALTQNEQLKKTLLKVQYEHKKDFFNKITVIKAYSKQANKGLAKSKETVLKDWNKIG